MKFKGINFSDDCKVIIVVNGQDNELTPPKQKSLQVINNIVDVTKLVAKVSSDSSLALSAWRSYNLQHNSNRKLIDRITLNDYQIAELKISPEDNAIIIGYQFTDNLIHRIAHKLTSGRLSGSAETEIIQ